jgi:hypothetical protein
MEKGSIQFLTAMLSFLELEADSVVLETSVVVVLMAV